MRERKWNHSPKRKISGFLGNWERIHSIIIFCYFKMILYFIKDNSGSSFTIQGKEEKKNYTKK